MGGAAALIGMPSTYSTAGSSAPVILILIRVLQGLALGGEYGGAAVGPLPENPEDINRFDNER